MTSTFLMESTLPPVVAGYRLQAAGFRKRPRCANWGGVAPVACSPKPEAQPRAQLQPEPLLLARHLVLADLDELAALHLIDGRLRRGPVVLRRVAHRRREAAQVEVLHALQRLLHALAVERVR